VRFAAAVLVIASALGTAPRQSAMTDPLPAFPRVVFWAWERPEKLPFLDPAQAGVAMLAGTIRLSGGHLGCQPRLQPLRVPAATPLQLTVRIESSDSLLPSAADVVDCALSFTGTPGVKALQIDFDARLSERAWYRGFLTELRRRMPASVRLTITALASWCESDGWIRGLPISEAVPMLFRMGPGEVWNRRDFDVALCRSSVGLATDELPARIPAHRRVYFFSPSRWTEDSYHAAWKEFRRLQ
jgi:hypothetical protein